MNSKRLLCFIFTAVLGVSVVPPVEAQYSTDWVANTYGLNATHVGNAARSMWVAPEGVVYTSSDWDENAGGVGIYQAGATVGSLGAHNEFAGSAITGNSSDLFVALAYSSAIGGSGKVGRYSRSTKVRDLLISVSADTTESKKDVVTGLATSAGLLYASDFPGNRVRVYTTSGVWQRDISVTGPGALAVDSSGNVWVAQQSNGTVVEYNVSSVLVNTIQLGSAARPASLYFDATNLQLLIGDEGPDMNIKIYNISGTPSLVGTFGVKGGYLDTTTGIKGQVGDKRFTRIVGLGKDSSGMLYVLNNPWGGSWDLGRNGETDIHAYDSTGTLQWKLQALNFEAIAAPDPGTDSAMFYSGNNIYQGAAGGSFVANTIDPFTYPSDARINIADPSRGEHFGQLAYVNGHRILVAAGQNPDTFYLYYFSDANGYVAIPLGSLPGTPFGTTARVRDGFCLDSKGDIWAGLDKTNAIWHYPLTGFDSTGKPMWGPGVSTPTPTTLGTMTRILYIPSTDTMILGAGITGSTDWTAIGTRIEVYHNWLAGNKTSPNPVITLTSTNPKSLAADGNYLFVGYVHTVPNIDVFDLTTGALTTTLINSSTSTVYVGNDVDSMYGLRAYLRSTGEYVVTKDDYNATNVVVYRWTPPSAQATPTMTATGNSCTYSGSPCAGSGTATGTDGTALSPVTLTYAGTGSTSYGPAANAPVDVGSYTVTASYAGDTSYTAATSSPAAITITQAASTTVVTGGTFQYDGSAHAASVSVTGPGLNLTPAASYTGSCASAPVTVAQGSSCTASYSYVGDNNHTASSGNASVAITTRPASVTANAASKVFGSADPVFTGTFVGFVPSDGVSASYTRTAGEAVGSYTISATLSPAAVLANYAVQYASAPFTITQSPTALVNLVMSPSTAQYSDPLNVSVNTMSSPGIGGTVSFFLDYGTATQTALGSPQTVAPNGTASVQSLFPTASSFTFGSHTVTAIFTPTDTMDYTGSVSSGTLTISPEDSAMTYTGQYVIFTGSVDNNSVTAPLTFTVQDSNAVAPSVAIYDAYPGDIRNARFKILVDGVASPGCSGLQPVLVSSDTRVGTIGCNYAFAIPSGQAGYTPTITVVADNGSYYVPSSGDNGFTISVNLPSLTNFITGGGFLVNSTSAGTYAGDAGYKTNFGFNVKYNNSGTNLNGHANILVQSHGHTYQIQSSSLTSMGVTDASSGGSGSFLAQVNIQDVTDPQNPIFIEANDSLTITFHDNGTPGTNDTISIAVYNGGTLRFSSNWTGTDTVEQSLGGGDLTAH